MKKSRNAGKASTSAIVLCGILVVAAVVLVIFLAKTMFGSKEDETASTAAPQAQVTETPTTETKGTTEKKTEKKADKKKAKKDAGDAEKK